jgi:hypothetical protein
MHPTARNQWLRPMLLAAAIYAVVGIATASFARMAPSIQMRDAWRLAAWLLSLLTFVGHIAYEQLRLRSAVRDAAAHCAAAVALGAFALALAGPVRSHWGATDFWRAAVLSLPLWPILTGLPAFMVGLVTGSILRRLLVRERPAPSNHVT